MDNGTRALLATLFRFAKRSFVSVFVVITFAAYAIHEHFYNSDGNSDALTPTPNAGVILNVTPKVVSAPTSTSLAPTNTVRPNATATPAPRSIPPTSTPVAPIAQGTYLDGEYIGSKANAVFGLVQVKAIIKNGKISDVQLLQYPTDRQTSRRINTVAVPRLQQEAIQSQNANVNIISGATLTSRAFIQSLQTALQSAKN